MTRAGQEDEQRCREKKHLECWAAERELCPLGRGRCNIFTVNTWGARPPASMCQPKRVPALPRLASDHLSELALAFGKMAMTVIPTSLGHC